MLKALQSPFAIGDPTSPAVAAQQQVLANQLNELKTLRQDMQAMYDSSQQEVVDVRAEATEAKAVAAREREKAATVVAENAGLRRWNETLAAELASMRSELLRGAAASAQELGLQDEADEAEAADVGQYWEVQEGKKRERKSLEAFKVEVAKPKEVETQKGTGTVLRDIPRIVELFGMHSIKKADPDDPLKNLSRLLYNKHGGPRECKNNILDFNGFSFADAKAEENMKNRIKKKQLKELELQRRVVNTLESSVGAFDALHGGLGGARAARNGGVRGTGVRGVLVKGGRCAARAFGAP